MDAILAPLPTQPLWTKCSCSSIWSSF